MFRDALHKEQFGKLVDLYGGLVFPCDGMKSTVDPVVLYLLSGVSSFSFDDVTEIVRPGRFRFKRILKDEWDRESDDLRLIKVAAHMYRGEKYSITFDELFWSHDFYELYKIIHHGILMLYGQCPDDWVFLKDNGFEVKNYLERIRVKEEQVAFTAEDCSNGDSVRQSIDEAYVRAEEIVSTAEKNGRIMVQMEQEPISIGDYRIDPILHITVGYESQAPSNFVRPENHWPKGLMPVYWSLSRFYHGPNAHGSSQKIVLGGKWECECDRLIGREKLLHFLMGLEDVFPALEDAFSQSR